MQEQKQSEREDRLKKLKELVKAGIDPYPSKSGRTHVIRDVLDNFDMLSEKVPSVSVCGRLRSIRSHGSLTFATIEDSTGLVQLAVSKKDVGQESYDLFIENVDTGDFIEASGKPFLTHKGEKSIMASGWSMLAKALRPIPDSWYGFKDEEERLRKRYLDMLVNKDVREIVRLRSAFWNSIRGYLSEKGFVEVETPVLETTAGGADARPFITHHNALDIDVYLRISMGELWQKRLMIAGFEKTFEIGRQFRNEGMDAEHLQDYTQMEFYWAYANYEDGMKIVEELVKYAAQKTFGRLEFDIRGFKVDLGGKWERYNYAEVVKQYTGIDIASTDKNSIKRRLDELGVEYDERGFNMTRAIDNLWKYCRKKIAGPGFLTGVPVTVSPLAKRDAKWPETTERFQLIIAGSELGNGYSELNDPIDQANRFSLQQHLREEGDEEAMMYDHEFVEALEYGMPPTCGFGMSERLFAFLMDKSARECQLFPLMRPKKQS